MARVLIAALLCLGLLAGCGDGDGGPNATVSFQLFGDPEEIAIYRDIARAYQRETGSRVRIVEVGDRKDHLAKLTTSFAARRPPDVFLINYRNIGGFAARRALDPIEPKAARPGGLDLSDLYPVTVDAFRFDGVVQCVPQNAASLVVYYNRDLFRAAGVKAPKAGWTYDEFVDVARKLKRGGRYAVATEVSAIRAAPFVWSAGGELVDDPTKPTRFTLDTPQARRGLGALRALRALDLAPDAKAEKSLPADERFLDGEVAMYLSSRRDVPTFRLIGDFTWDVAPFPVIERPANVLHSDGFCLSRGPRAEAAWRFVEFAAGPVGQRLLAKGGRTVPSLKSVAESGAFLASRPPASNRVFLDQVAATRRLPTSRQWTRIEESVDLAIEQYFYGRLSLDDAIERIQRETRGRF